MPSITIVLQCPLKPLLPNIKTHYKTKMGATKRYRQHAYIMSSIGLGYREFTNTNPEDSVQKYSLLPEGASPSTIELLFRINTKILKRSEHPDKKSLNRPNRVIPLKVIKSLPWHTATICINYYARTAHKIDPDNILASLKAAFDGIVDAGILSDDKDVAYMPIVRHKDAENPRVEIEIRKGISAVLF